MKMTTNERYLSPSEAAECLPRRPHPFSIIRWIREGVVTPSGRVRLDATKVGGHWMILADDLQKFLRRTTSGSLAVEKTVAPRVLRIQARDDRRRHRKAVESLQASGIM